MIGTIINMQEQKRFILHLKKPKTSLPFIQVKFWFNMLCETKSVRPYDCL